MPFKKDRQTALTVLSVLLIIFMLLYTLRLYSLQVIYADRYSSAAGSTSVRTAVLKAPRGEILDRYGRQIAVNRDGYNIVFNKAYFKKNVNNTILTLINLLSEKGVEWVDKLPLEKTAPYGYKQDESHKKLLKILGLADYATAENCYARMVENYGLENYTPDEQRLIMGVRYSMQLADFSISYPYTFAEDVPTEIMRAVCESGLFLNGVTVDIAPFRQYVDTTLAVNLIGSIGPIYEEDWDNETSGENYKARGYSYNDKVGVSGIEYYAEDLLRGKDGEITYYIDASGNIIKSEITKAPVSGKTVMLTMDKAIQRTAQDSLKSVITDLKAHGGTVKAGSAVMVDVSSGGVICSANYPSYDTATLSQDIEALNADPDKPLTDRAFMGVYPIGSTIKPIVATAAMEHNLYQAGEMIKCVQTYDYFSEYQPRCLHYHGFIDLKTALSKSCNYFFYELGRRVGSVMLTDYFKQFGLGVKTGVEVNDSKGILVEPKSNTLDGNTLQISIGQLNAFTPLQLANYAATFANGGTHYRATLIDKVMSYDLSKTYDTCKPEVVNTVEISEATLKAIKEGMHSVTVDGTGSRVFSDYPITIGGKTGTSQTDSGADHSTYIVFAPYDKPQIAISVILEHGDSGTSAGTIVRNLLDAYFMDSATEKNTDTPYVVLN